ncbi:MAG: Smr/MutS family protein [Spirochaetes bacterium]|jgi:DNA-nicking Smr family endonuclease|nr:Smr/MutS family protein [Spirochaetota bacterium]
MNDKPVEIDPDGEMDLHHFHPRDAKAVLREFIEISINRGLPEVRIVHGRGRSVIKKMVLDELGKNPDVEEFGDDGANWGATRVRLRIRG